MDSTSADTKFFLPKDPEHQMILHHFVMQHLPSSFAVIEKHELDPESTHNQRLREQGKGHRVQAVKELRTAEEKKKYMERRVIDHYEHLFSAMRSFVDDNSMHVLYTDAQMQPGCLDWVPVFPDSDMFKDLKERAIAQLKESGHLDSGSKKFSSVESVSHLHPFMPKFRVILQVLCDRRYVERHAFMFIVHDGSLLFAEHTISS